MFKFNDFNYYSGPFQVLPDRLLSNLSKLYSTHTDFVTPLPTLDKKILIILSFLGLKEERAKFWLSTTPHVWGFQLNEEFFCRIFHNFRIPAVRELKRENYRFFAKFHVYLFRKKIANLAKFIFRWNPGSGGMTKKGRDGGIRREREEFPNLLCLMYY